MLTCLSQHYFVSLPTNEKGCYIYRGNSGTADGDAGRAGRKLLAAGGGELLTLAVSHLLALALAKLAQRLNINTVFPESLFHRQWLFGCKVTKFSTKAFIARQKMLSGVKV